MSALAAIVLGLSMLSAACTTATPDTPPIVNVRGIWIGDWAFEPASAGRGIFTMTLAQTGTDVTGAVQRTGLDRTSPTAVTGVLKGDEIHLTGMAATGVLKVRGNEMTGTLDRGGQTSRVIARRQTD